MKNLDIFTEKDKGSAYWLYIKVQDGTEYHIPILVGEVDFSTSTYLHPATHALEEDKFPVICNLGKIIKAFDDR